MTIRRSVLGPLAFGAALLPLPFVLPPYYLHVAVVVLLWGYMSSTWNILAGYGGAHSFGHSMYVGLGAYSLALLQSQGLNPWLCIIVAILGGAGLGWVTGYGLFRRGLTGAYYAFATIAITEAFSYIISNLRALGGASGVEVPVRNGLAAMQSSDVIWYFLVILALNVAILVFMQAAIRGRFFYSLMAARDNEAAAAAVGINSVRVKTLASVLSGALCAVAGVFYMQYYLYAGPKIFSSMLATQIMLFALVGGEGTVWGPLVGAIILVPVGEYLRTEASVFQGADLIVYGAVLALVMMFMPKGLLGSGRELAGAYGRLVARRTIREDKHSGETDSGETDADSAGGAAGEEPA